MARLNGGITGVSNKTSFGKDKITTKTSSGNVCTQPGTRLAKVLVVAGGGSGAKYGGGGAGGLRNLEVPVNGGSAVPITIGAGGAAAPADTGNKGSNSSIVGTCSTQSSTGGGLGTGEEVGQPGGSGSGGGYGPGGPGAGGDGLRKSDSTSGIHSQGQGPWLPDCH